MKIAFLAPHLKISGGVRILLTYASLLEKRGHEVTVYVIQSKQPLRRMLCNVFGIGLPAWIPHFSAQVRRVEAIDPAHVSRADVLVATTWQTALALDNFPTSYGSQWYLVQHDEGLYHGDRAKVDKALALPQHKIVVSTWLQQILRDRFNQSSRVLINPVDASLFHQLPRTAEPGTVRVLLLHHTYAWKGTEEGVRIVERVRSRHPEVRLILFGVRDKSAIEYPYDEYHYNLPQSKLAQLYSDTDIFLCASWEEGFGLPSVEAMRCGAALVTYDNGGSRDFAFNGETAFVAPHRDVEALERCLEDAVSNAVLRARIAAAGKSFVEHMPTWEEQTKELERIFTATP
jgi:glycosyltransferase involved in cell wall biosynthesis